MSKLKKLITEIHHRSLWQVLLIYVAVARVPHSPAMLVNPSLSLIAVPI